MRSKNQSKIIPKRYNKKRRTVSGKELFLKEENERAIEKWNSMEEAKQKVGNNNYTSFNIVPNPFCNVSVPTFL